MVLIYPRQLTSIHAMCLKREEKLWDEYRIRIGVKTIEDIQISSGTHACLFDQCNCELIYFKIDKNSTN